MILEKLPELQRLPADQKRLLAEELWQSADGVEEIEVDPAVLELLESRLAAQAAGTMTTSSWEEVRQRVFRNHGA